MCVPSLARTVVYIVVRATWGQKRSRDQHLSDSITWTARSEHVVQGPRIILNIISRSGHPDPYTGLLRLVVSLKFLRLFALASGAELDQHATLHCACAFSMASSRVWFCRHEVVHRGCRLSIQCKRMATCHRCCPFSILAHRNGWLISLFNQVAWTV